MKILVAAVAIGIGLSGCASMGHNFNEKNLSQLQPGVTTEAQAVALLGAEPTSRTFTADGSYMATWQYVNVVFISTTDNKLVYLMFDKNHVFKNLVSETVAN